MNNWRRSFPYNYSDILHTYLYVHLPEFWALKMPELEDIWWKWKSNPCIWIDILSFEESWKFQLHIIFQQSDDYYLYLDTWHSTSKNISRKQEVFIDESYHNGGRLVFVWSSYYNKSFFILKRIPTSFLYSSHPWYLQWSIKDRGLSFIKGISYTSSTTRFFFYLRSWVPSKRGYWIP